MVYPIRRWATSSPNDLHFPQQIGVKWGDAATTFPSFCSPRSPNRTGFGMGRLKPRPTAKLLGLVKIAHGVRVHGAPNREAGGERGDNEHGGSSRHHHRQ